MDFDWRAVVKTVAPTIGTALAGPLGGAALGALTRALLGTDAAPDEAAVAKALETATPELLLKLKQAEHDFVAAMKKLDIDLAHLDNEDRQNARAREIALKDWAPSALALTFVVGFFLCQYWVLTEPMPEGSETVVARVLGTMDAAVVMILSYYFGSSRGSDRKTELMIRGEKGATRPRGA